MVYHSPCQGMGEGSCLQRWVTSEREGRCPFVGESWGRPLLWETNLERQRLTSGTVRLTQTGPAGLPLLHVKMSTSTEVHPHCGWYTGDVLLLFQAVLQIQVLCLQERLMVPTGLYSLYMLLLCKMRWAVSLIPYAVYLSGSADSSLAYLQLSGQHVSSTLLQSGCLVVERIFLIFRWSVFGHPLKRSNKSLEFELTG